MECIWALVLVIFVSEFSLFFVDAKVANVSQLIHMVYFVFYTQIIKFISINNNQKVVMEKEFAITFITDKLKADIQTNQQPASLPVKSITTRLQAMPE
jgi:hypothetical protein